MGSSKAGISGNAGSPVIIEEGPSDWQVIQRDSKDRADISLSGSWSTIIRRKKPEVMVRVAPEGDFRPITRAHDWKKARLVVDRSVKGKQAGKSGTWAVVLRDIPAGGPYRIETNVGSTEDAPEWRRCGDSIHFVGVGDIWLIAGQSNAEGYAREPIDDPSEIGVHQLGWNGRWSIAAHETRHNPWIAFGKKLKGELGVPIGLIPTAIGGSALSQWDPGQKGQLYNNMKGQVELAGSRLKGVAWYQGESDTGESDHPKYKMRFARFVKGLRRLTKNHQLPFITVQLNRVLGQRDDASGWEAMREVQRAITHEIDDVYVFSIFEAGLSDGIHISSLGNLLIAQRAAATALGAVYGRPGDYLHPECVSARKVGRKAVELGFTNVVGGLYYEFAPEGPLAFAVRDKNGDVDIAGVEIKGKNRMRLLLERPLEGRATVVGAPGNCPPEVVPRDLSGYRGMLGFTKRID